MREQIVNTVPYNELDQDVREKVLITFMEWIKLSYGYMPLSRNEAAAIIEASNPEIIFFINERGEKLFRSAMILNHQNDHLLS